MDIDSLLFIVIGAICGATSSFGMFAMQYQFNPIRQPFSIIGYIWEIYIIIGTGIMLAFSLFSFKYKKHTNLFLGYALALIILLDIQTFSWTLEHSLR